MLVKILIFLVAVVVLIVIIAFLALRYLRAEDSDPFDELPDEPRRRARAPADEPRIDEAPTMVAPTRQRRPALADDRQYPADRGPGRPADGRVAVAERAGGPARERQPAGYRDRGSQPRPAAADRQGSQTGGQRPLAASARSRQAAKNGQEPNWDSLSDVDYWAELAAQKPMAAASAPASPSRRPSGQAADGRLHPADGRSAPRSEPVSGPQPPLPVRRPSPPRTSGPRPAQPRAAQPNGTQPRTAQPLAAAASPRSRSGEYDQPRQPEPRGQHAPGRYRGIADGTAGNGAGALSGPSPAAAPLAAPTPLAGPPSAGLPPTAPAAHASRSHSRGRQQVPADDDPLTSPSFPAINTSDSRSYRTRRADSQPGIARPAAAYSEPAQQFNGYPQAPERPARVPDGYSSQPGSQPPVAAVGNPYGSYVSQSPAGYQPPTAHQPPAAHQDAAYSAGYLGGGQLEPEPAPAPPPGQWPGQQGNLGGFGRHATVPGLGPVENGYPAAPGHQPLPGGNLPYPDPARYPQHGYQPEQYDQRGYATSDAAYGLDSYPGYPGYGSPAR
jgi:hypothetical protein